FRDKAALILESFQEVIRPVFLGLSIIMIVYIPILSLEGIEGKMFHPMAVTVLMALGTSLAVAVFLMPVLSFVFLFRPSEFPEKHDDPFLFRILSRVYEKVLHYTMKNTRERRMTILASSGIVFVISAGLFLELGSDFMPPLNEGDMVVNITHPAEISLSEAVIKQKIAEKKIREFKEVRHVFGRIGTPESATDPMGVNLADTFLILHDTSDWPEAKNGRRRTKEELYEDIEKAVAPLVPEAEVSYNQPIAMRFNEILEGSRADVSLRIYGKDLNMLMLMQDEAVEILESIEGIDEAELDAITALRKSPVMQVKLNYENINKYGMDIHSVNENFLTAMAGKETGSYFEYDWRFPVIVKMAEENKNDYGSLKRIPIDLPEPGTIPLGRVADFHESDEVVAIARANGRRYAGIAVSLGDRDTLSFVKEAKEKIENGLDFEEGYRVVWGGQYKNLERAKKQLLIVIPFVLLFVSLLLYQNFESVRQTLLVLTSIPFAITGGIILLYLRGINFSVSSSVGFITLSGIAILNGMVMISFINQLRESGMHLRDAVIKGAFTRLRPVVMTALVAMLGFFPMAVNTGLGAEVQRPLATVVIGGLISSTILTLFLLPMLYYWLESSSEK
ncbi:MAG: efflux RND transporter permease subunit, partial [Spirochaetia bacterium]|nr:efflux RND transporter permease subunit [Spirochaetia bacterium]